MISLINEAGVGLPLLMINIKWEKTYINLIGPIIVLQDYK